MDLVKKPISAQQCLLFEATIEHLIRLVQDQPLDLGTRFKFGSVLQVSAVGLSGSGAKP